MNAGTELALPAVLLLASGSLVWAQNPQVASFSVGPDQTLTV
jgi:hypothetical protein